MEAELHWGMAALSTRPSECVSSTAYSNVHSFTFRQTWLLLSQVSNTQVPYTKVCGRARGYQFGYAHAFYSSKYAGQDNPEKSYVSGLSVTHGAPGNREHIWTFAAGYSKANGYVASDCPCLELSNGTPAPDFVGEDYFCESGSHDRPIKKWYFDDPLWDSMGCNGNDKSCCDLGPWFNTTLSRNVSDDIEVRWCHFPSYTYIEDIAVDELEIYVS